MDEDRNHPNFHEAQTVERPFTVKFSEHDLRHLRRIIQKHAIEKTDWASVRCAVRIYERINEQLSKDEKNLLAGPPEPQRKRTNDRT